MRLKAQSTETIVFLHIFTNEGKEYTPLKINMEPKNGGLEDDFPFHGGDFQVPC